MAKKVTYQASWENDFLWVKRSSIPGNAKCVICRKDNIYFASMGRSALRSHEQGKKHKELMKNYKSTVPIQTWISSSSQSQPYSSGPSQQDLSKHQTFPLDQPGPSKPSSSATTQFSHKPFLLDQPGSSQSSTVPLEITETDPATPENLSTHKTKWWLEKDEVSKAEILWCAHTTITHQSLRNAEAAVNMFKVMFPDSKIAQDMKLGKDKTSYVILYGLAPYFRDHLLKSINRANYYVVGFDESLNKFSQKLQLDIVVRFWDDNCDEVSSRYISSVFLTGSKAEDLLDGIKEGLKGLDWKKIMQVSMDGPNVNVKLLRILKKEIEVQSSDNHKILDIGSCGLHVLNVAFKTGFSKTGWDLTSFLRACYYLFKDSPSRRGVFIKITNSSVFPLKFCGVRWLENTTVAKRALELLENLKKYVLCVKNDKTQKATQTSKSFKCVDKFLEDKLLQPKLAFFISVAEDLEPFLRQYQTESPMVPFLYNDLLSILKVLMGTIVKEEVMKSKSLKSISLDDNENLKPTKTIDLGYGTKSALRKCSNVKDIDILKLKQDCKVCLTALLEKVLEKSPLKYELTEALSFLDPKEIQNDTKAACKNMTKAMEILEESNLLSASCVQKADREYNSLTSDATILQQMKEYSRKTPLDSFWKNILKTKNGENLEKVIKLFLTMSHGNSTLERGFSVNGDLIVENLSEESLIAQRLIYDTIQSCGGLQKLIITKEMILSVRNANNRWKEALKLKREKLEGEAKVKAEKRKLAALAKELEEKKKKLVTDAARDVAKIEEKIKEIQKQI